MEASTTNADFIPSIKCSDCGKDIHMEQLGRHQCVTSKTSLPGSARPPPPPRTDSSNSTRSLRSQRPSLPKIDLSATFRPPALQGELTPANSQHSSMASPASASPGPTSPWPRLHNASAPVPRRPPSPELTNLDCAFPPFPVPPKGSTTKARDKSSAQRSDTHRSRSRNAPRLPLFRPLQDTGAGSSSHGNEDRNYKPSDMRSNQSNPSTTSSRSTSLKDSSLQQVVEEGRGVKDASPSEKILGPASGAPIQLVRSQTEPQNHHHPPANEALSAFNFGDILTTKVEATKTTTDLPIMLPGDKVRADTEPTYRSKRPPPLSRDQFSSIAKIKAPAAPQPSSAGVLSKGLGKIFGRRRSQSMKSRREVVRQALSDEPDVYESQFTEHNNRNGQGTSFLITEPSPLSSPFVTSPLPRASHEESLKALEGTTPAPMPVPAVLVEPTAESGLPDTTPSAPGDVYQSDKPQDLSMDSSDAQPRPHEIINSLRRVSIDSASSYGSVGFSEHATSSVSSSSNTESLQLKSFDSSILNTPQSMNLDIPAPLKLGRGRTLVDSPTDPLFQQGRLSPLPDLFVAPIEQRKNSQSNINEPAIEASRSPAQDAAHSRKGKPVGSNKGFCRGCSQVILSMQKSVSSADGRLTGRYHKECFVCQTCKSSFPTAEFYVHNDHPYCAQHYHELENSLCATCGKGIEGLYMETANVAGRGKEKHHPECLKCTTCKIRLDHDYFELSGKVYCERDAFRMANSPKSRDNAPTRPSPLIREYISSGDRGLLKGRQFPERRTTRLMNMT
ncbi:hypothetical protein HRR86_003104 [Exophiala dermatitidis]|nr:hypothetical protein HRR75_003968 [Exophiala dermatitidis]KAJ4518036.1 hypothetical protein HRR74_004331 [Exophiala dermatitidis]KAJ4520935.1 hypothetical protein HRR73_003276 [Exophiala dermatitidis]KAJ4579754.1 hypothetical protein HRR82_004887 [Exophiala dermatitidis]KAJ4621993.1 hypothetical protein HRR88_005675 [Exophiala dermatitidis]